MTRKLRTALVLAAAAALLFAVAVAWRSWKAAAREFHPPRRAPVSWPAGAPEVARQDEQFVSGEGDAIRAWFVPSRNGAAVVMVHGTEADRSQLAPEIRALAAAGFGVLAFDEPGCGESGGRVSWGHSERAALRAALDWLAAHGGRHLGVLGFSQGSYIAVQVAVDDPRVEALALEGVVVDFRELTWHEFHRWGVLSFWPAWLGRRFAGYRRGDPQPAQLMNRFHGSLLVIRGALDHEVPPAHAGEIYQASHGPKEQWIVPGAGHGGYAAASPEEYPRRLIAFFTRSLVR